MSFELIKTINGLIATGTRDFYLRQPEKRPGEYVQPNLYIGAVPPKRKGNIPGHDDNSIFPFVVNRLVSGIDDYELSTLNVHTVCGIYTGEGVEAGEHDVINLVMRIKRLLTEVHILEERFTRIPPLEWNLGDPEDKYLQAFPYFGGVVKTTWTAPTYEPILTAQEAAKVYGEIE